MGRNTNLLLPSVTRAYTEKMLKRPDYHQFIADKDKQYRHETSVMMAVLADMRGITPTTKQENESGWYKNYVLAKSRSGDFHAE